MFLPFSSDNCAVSSLGVWWQSVSSNLRIPVSPTSVRTEHSGALLPPAGQEGNDRCQGTDQSDSVHEWHNCSDSLHLSTVPLVGQGQRVGLTFHWLQTDFYTVQNLQRAKILLLNTHCNRDPALNLVSTWILVSLYKMTGRGSCIWLNTIGHCSKFPLCLKLSFQYHVAYIRIQWFKGLFVEAIYGVTYT